MSLPLEGMLVVAMDQAVAAPFAASRLADAGARVIKVERPGGDFARGYDSVVNGESAYFVWLNRGKESIELDIKKPEDAALLDRMIARADVFIQNLAPGAAARAGFGAEDLRRKYPRLITCDLSGYGEDGPYRDMKAYDLLIQAETGLASITGGPEAPGRVGVSIVDIAAGMYAVNAILQAIIARGRTGEGASIKVSLFDAMADWMAVPLLYQDMTGKAPKRVGLAHPSIAPYGAYETGDGKAIVIAIQNEREWVRFCAEILGDADIASDPRFCTNIERVANRAALDEIVKPILASATREEWAERLRAAAIAFGSLNSVADLSKHPQLRRMSLETPAGPASIPAPPAIFVGQDRPLKPVPAAGQDNERLREEFAEDDPVDIRLRQASRGAGQA